MRVSRGFVTHAVLVGLSLIATVSGPVGLAAQAAPAPSAADPRLDRLKAEASGLVDAKAKMIQQMVDQVFSYGELGMQEVETSKYLSDILEKNGFTLQRGVAGIPTAWVARWGSGKPVISLGSDIDGIPQSNQRPATGFRDWIVPGAPGHGEGHNSGVPLNIAAALVVKDIMTREKMTGTIVLWPGVAEEQLASKAFLVRAGLLSDCDAVLHWHPSSTNSAGDDAKPPIASGMPALG
jgi:aminobenzoyl-glutamate utilization protein B